MLKWRVCYGEPDGSPLFCHCAILEDGDEAIEALRLQYEHMGYSIVVVLPDYLWEALKRGMGQTSESQA